MSKKKYREGYRIALGRIIALNKFACSQFCNWVNDNDNISEYDTENIVTHISFGSCVYERSIQWYRIKGAMYDFFDFNYMFVSVGTSLEPFSADSTRFFEWDIDVLNGSVMDNEFYDTRVEAEEAAFTKAFELLEEKICR